MSSVPYLEPIEPELSPAQTGKVGKSTEKVWMVRPNLPTRAGDQKIILYPPTDTLVLSFTMHGLWVLPADIDMKRYKQALAQTMTIFAPAAGRLRKFPDTKRGKGDIYIELNNHGIAVGYVDDYETAKVPMENVLVHPQDMEKWVIPMPMQIINTDEPLVRFKFTKLHKTGQTVYTLCWLHALGDGHTANLFMTYTAHLYRGASTAALPLPTMTKVFFQSPPKDPTLAEKFPPLMKHIRDAKPIQELCQALTESEERTLPVHISFTRLQLQILTRRAVSAMPDPTARLSKVDAAVAYLVLHYNRVLADLRPNHEQIDTVVNTLDYRGNPRFAPVATIGNCAITLTCPSFKLPPVPPPNAGPRERNRHFDKCLAAICSSIRFGTLQARDTDFLEPYLQFHNEFCRRAYEEDLFQYILPANDREITFNSSHAANWHGAADFFPAGSKWANGRYTRFHTSVVIERYIRIFEANPIFIPGKRGRGGKWDFSLVGGVEAAFKLDKAIAKTFEERVSQDLKAGIGYAFTQL